MGGLSLGLLGSSWDLDLELDIIDDGLNFSEEKWSSTAQCVVKEGGRAKQACLVIMDSISTLL